MSHRHVYKYKKPEVGKKLYEMFETGSIQKEEDFLLQLKILEENNGR